MSRFTNYSRAYIYYIIMSGSRHSQFKYYAGVPKQIFAWKGQGSDGALKEEHKQLIMSLINKKKSTTSQSPSPGDKQIVYPPGTNKRGRTDRLMDRLTDIALELYKFHGCLFA